MKKKFHNNILLGFILLFWGQLYAQNYADSKYYLIDSLKINVLSTSEKKLIDSSLQVFHTTKIDTIKAITINSLVAYLPNEEIWSQYNNWLTEFTSKKLKNSQLTDKERKLLTNIQALTLNNEGYRLRGKSKYNEALEVYLKSLVILEGIGDKSGQGNVLNNIGAVYNNLGNIPEALVYHQKSLLLKRETKNKKGEAYSINNIAIIYRSLGDINKALEYYLLSLNILEEVEDKKGIAVVLNNVATIYRNQGNKLKAKEYFEKSLGMHKEAKNKRSMAITLSHLAVIYDKEGDKNKSKTYYIESLRLNKEIGDRSGEAGTLSSLGKFYIRNKESEKGFGLLQESLEMFNAINDRSGEISCLNNIAKYYLDQNNLLEAKKSALKSLKRAKEIGFPSEIKAAAEILTTIYEKEGNWSQAYTMQKLYVKMQDSINSKSLQESILKQQTKYDVNKKEQEIKVLSVKNESLKKDREIQTLRNNKNRLAILLISIALLVTLLFIAFNAKWNEKKKKIYILLKKQKEEISLKNDEKTAMLKEIHHRVKNNLQIVNSLLKFQSREIKDKNVVAIFEKAQKRVVSMALLHEKMYNSEDLKHIDVKEYISLLIFDLVSTYSIGKKISLDIVVDNVHIGMRTLVPLGLIINEIITNSFKHAFIDTLEGTIKVHIRELKSGSYEMYIGDNGIGFTDKLKPSKTGTKLINAFIKQLNGTTELLNQQGTMYKIIFEKID